MSAYSNLDLAVDLARTEYSKDLRKNPSDYSNYVFQNAQAIQDQITAAKTSAFDKAQTDLGRYMDLQHNVQLYEIRNSDVDRLTTALANNNESIQSAVKRDKDVTRRQFEINEWYNYKKEQTAATLMGGVVMMVIILGLVVGYKMGVLPAPIAGSLAGVTVVLFSLWAYYRPNTNQDPRLWHRRIFTTSTEPPVSTECPGKINVDITKQKDCLSVVEGKLSDLTAKLDADLAAYQTGDLSVTPPKSICSS
jgi:hypothetical protein